MKAAPTGAAPDADSQTSPPDSGTLNTLDPADALENNRELLGDRAAAAQDFSSEEAGYHKTLTPRQIQTIAIAH